MNATTPRRTRPTKRAALRTSPADGLESSVQVMEDLIGQPIIAVTWAKTRYGVSFQAANEAVTRLVKDGILEEMTGGNYDRLFVARRVL